MPGVMGQRRHAATAKQGMELRNAVGAEQMDGGYVQRAGERLCRRHGTVKLQVEILRREPVDIHGDIRQERTREDGPFLQGGGIEEGFQDAAGRARGAQDIDLASRSFPQRGGVPDVGDGFPGAEVENDGGKVRDAAAVEFIGPAVRDRLHRLLEVQPHGGPGTDTLRRLCHEVRGMGRQGMRRVRQGLLAGEFVGGFVDVAMFHQPLQQAVPLFEQGLPPLSRMDAGRGVRENGEGGRLAPGQILRRAPEIAPRRGLESDDIAAERGVGRIEREDFILGAAQFQPCREDGLHGLLPERPLPAARQADDLHCQRAAAALHFPRADVLHEGTGNGPRIDAGMIAEVPVLELDESGFIPFRYAVARGKAPLPVRRDPGPEQVPAGIFHDRRTGDSFEEVPRQAAKVGRHKDGHT